MFCAGLFSIADLLLSLINGTLGATNLQLVRMQFHGYGAGSPGVVESPQCVNDIAVHEAFQLGVHIEPPARSKSEPRVGFAALPG